MQKFNLTLGTPDDVEDIVGLMLEAQEESLYKGLPVDVQRLSENVGRWVAGNTNTHVLLSRGQETGVLAGVLIFLVTDSNEMFPGVKMAQEILFYIDKPYRSTGVASMLRKAYELNAEETECLACAMSSQNNEYSERLDAVYRRSGYVKTETHYLKVLA